MASNKIEEGQSFTWGNTVRVQANAPSEFRPGEIGEICSISSMPVAETKRLYLVEFADGLAIEVPGTYLEKISE